MSDLPLVTQIVRDADCGLIVPWDSPKAHAEALAHLLENPDEARRMGANGRRAILERMNWETERDALVSFYDTFLRRRTPQRVPSHPELA